MEVDLLECQVELTKLILESFNINLRWTNKLKTVIFSIDYRLAPEYAYP